MLVRVLWKCREESMVLVVDMGMVDMGMVVVEFVVLIGNWECFEV